MLPSDEPALLVLMLLLLVLLLVLLLLLLLLLLTLHPLSNTNAGNHHLYTSTCAIMMSAGGRGDYRCS